MLVLAVKVSVFPTQGAKLPEEEVMVVTAGGKYNLERMAVFTALTAQTFTA